jgi:hypothetical protein
VFDPENAGGGKLEPLDFVVVLEVENELLAVGNEFAVVFPWT